MKTIIFLALLGVASAQVDGHEGWKPRPGKYTYLISKEDSIPFENP